MKPRSTKRALAAIISNSDAFTALDLANDADTSLGFARRLCVVLRRLGILRAHRLYKYTVYEVVDRIALREFAKEYGITFRHGKPIRCPYCRHTWLTQARNTYITCPKCYKAQRAPWLPKEGRTVRCPRCGHAWLTRQSGKHITCSKCLRRFEARRPAPVAYR